MPLKVKGLGLCATTRRISGDSVSSDDRIEREVAQEVDLDSHAQSLPEILRAAQRLKCYRLVARQGAVAMKISLDFECTPEEARKFFGLPEVQPLQEAVLKEVQEQLFAQHQGDGRQDHGRDLAAGDPQGFRTVAADVPGPDGRRGRPERNSCGGVASPPRACCCGDGATAVLPPLAELCADPAVMEFLTPLSEPGALPRLGRRGCALTGGSTASAAGLSKSPARRALSGSSVWPRSPTRPISPQPSRSPGGWREPIGATAMPPRPRAPRSGYGFDQLGLTEIVAVTVPANLRSRRVMQRLGMSRAAQDDFDHPDLPPGPAAAPCPLPAAAPRLAAVTICWYAMARPRGTWSGDIRAGWIRR